MEMQERRLLLQRQRQQLPFLGPSKEADNQEELCKAEKRSLINPPPRALPHL
ncbi:hypothetical protein Emed_004117 [Eimeria media]